MNPRCTSQKCNACGYIEASNRDKEKFICLSCGHMAHADINAAKNLEELAMSNIASMVRRDSAEPEPRGSKRPRTKSARTTGCKRVEPGNPSNRDMLAEKSSEFPRL